MKQNTKTTTEKVALEASENEMVMGTHVGQDLKSSILIVSVVANLFVFTAWVALQVTSQFDAQFANMLYTR